MTCRNCVLDVDIDGTVGIRNETGAITDAVSIDRIRYKVVLHIAHRQRPKCTIRRKLSCWKVHEVIVLAGELMVCAIYGRRPVHRLLRYVYGRKFIGARGAQKNVIARLAASENGGPAVDCRDRGVEENDCREKCQQSPHDYSLHYICDDGSPEHDGEH